MDHTQAKQRIAELTEQLNRYNYEYYMNDTSLVSDFEFDKLLEELTALEKAFPQYALPTSPTKRVGGEVNKSFRQVTHRYPMLSLGNTYSVEEITEFDTRVRNILGDRQFSYVCELKYDGVAIGLTYKDGALTQAVTRGNGVQGDYILCDRENHASIYDGCKLSYAKMLRYQHNDMEDLERHLQKVPESAGILIVTDGVFSMSGDIARLPEIVKLAKKQGLYTTSRHG